MSLKPTAQTQDHLHVDILRTVYGDLERLADYSAESIVLHRADRTLTAQEPCRGLPAVMAHIRALLTMTNNTFIEDVQHIVANDNFGTVLGVIRATYPQQIYMPFCGLWQFSEGRIVEHWENAYDPMEMAHLLTPLDEPES